MKTDIPGRLKNSKYFSLLTIILILNSCNSHAPDQTTNEVDQITLFEHAAVVTAHPLASQVGRDILLKGGNAIDAAIAVQFALAVVFPAAGNIGGGGFMIIRTKNGNYYALDFREKAPLKAHRDMYLDEEGNIIENASLYGHLAAGVPGSVDGMIKAYEKFGTLSWNELLQPAVDFAENGFQLTENEANGLNSNRERFLKYNTIRSDNVLNEKGWQVGDTICYRDLARTLIRIRDFKRDGFYSGETAELIVEEMERGHGLITSEDLKNYESIWREPVSATYKNHKITSMGPPSSGGICLIQLLKMVEDYPLSEFGWHSEKHIHLVVEAEKRMYADRSVYMGDWDFFPVPVKTLIDEKYLRERLAVIDFNKASMVDNIIPGQISIPESEETTHFSIVDASGNAVAVTTTINGWFGCQVMVAGAGFFLNNEMDDFITKPEYSNADGLTGDEANAIQPGKRMMSSMTPTIIEKNGKLKMVLGTPGGLTIITSVFQIIVNVLDFNMGMQEAVEAPRFHHQWKPEPVFYEEGAIDDQVILKLQEFGHKLEKRGSIGRVDAILIHPDGTLKTGADPRGDDTAAGY